jgi:hypothetical protein
VARLLKGQSVEAVVIGAVALAAYHYVRQTEDVDLGINASAKTLKNLKQILQKAGYPATLRLADAEDPLGGVIDIEIPAGYLQIISFAGRFPAVIEDAVRSAQTTIRPGSQLKLVPLPHLIALKLYAGGHKSKADIIELLARNPTLDLGEVRQLCQTYQLGGLEELIEEAGLLGWKSNSLHSVSHAPKPQVAGAGTNLPFAPSP